MTSRRAIGTGALAVAIGALCGRDAVNAAVARWVAASLGLPVPATTALVERMQDRIGPARYGLLMSRFALAGTYPVARLASPAFRGRVMRPFVEGLMGDLAGTLTYLGAVDHPADTPCGGLLEG